MVTAFCGVVALGAGVLIGYKVLSPDTGVQACEAMRENADKQQSGEDASMTASEYREIRKVFMSSNHEELRDAGTRFIDVSWQLASKGKQAPSEGAVLMYGAELISAYTDLVGACAAQGVEIPTLDQLSKN